MAVKGNIASMIIGAVGDALRGTSNSLKNAQMRDDGSTPDFTPEKANEGVTWADQFNIGGGSGDNKDVANNIGGIVNMVKAAKAAKAASDERAKTADEIDNVSDELIEEMAEVKPFHFYYKPEAAAIDDTGSIDSDPHIGIKAQDLEKQPLLNSIVSENDNGLKEIDIKEMTLANSAAISALINKLKEKGVLDGNYR